MRLTRTAPARPLRPANSTMRGTAPRPLPHRNAATRRAIVRVPSTAPPWHRRCRSRSRALLGPLWPGSARPPAAALLRAAGAGPAAAGPLEGEAQSELTPRAAAEAALRASPELLAAREA